MPAETVWTLLARKKGTEGRRGSQIAKLDCRSREFCRILGEFFPLLLQEGTWILLTASDNLLDLQISDAGLVNLRLLSRDGCESLIGDLMNRVNWQIWPESVVKLVLNSQLFILLVMSQICVPNLGWFGLTQIPFLVIRNHLYLWVCLFRFLHRIFRRFHSSSSSIATMWTLERLSIS